MLLLRALLVRDAAGKGQGSATQGSAAQGSHTELPWAHCCFTPLFWECAPRQGLFLHGHCGSGEQKSPVFSDSLPSGKAGFLRLSVFSSVFLETQY